MKKFEIAIFDLDGVLSETSKQHYLAWKRLADELGLEFDEVINEELKGVSRERSLEIILDYNYKQDEYSDRDKQEFAQRKNGYYKELIQEITEEDLFVGVRELFEKLKEEKIIIALASASHNAPFLINKLKVDKYIDYVVDPTTLTRSKPDPEIFRKAVQHFGMASDKAVGFEDSVAGIKSIKAAGMYAVGIGNRETLHEADVVYSTMQDVCFQDLFYSHSD